MKGHPVPYLVISILYVHVTYYTDTPRPVPSFVNGIWSRMAADAGADDGTDGDQRWIFGSMRYRQVPSLVLPPWSSSNESDYTVFFKAVIGGLCLHQVDTIY